MGLVIYRQHREIIGLRQTVGDAGYLVIDDESQYHAIYVPTYDKLSWRWRVWLPEGNTYELATLCNKPRVSESDYPPEGVVRLGKRGGILPGEHILTVALKKSDALDTWRVHFEVSEITEDGGESTYRDFRQVPLNGGGWPDDSSGMGSYS